jgi:hypothetical protein
MNDPSISRTAESIVKQFGDQAPAYCAWKIVDTLECGDLTRSRRGWRSGRRLRLYWRAKCLIRPSAHVSSGGSRGRPGAAGRTLCSDVGGSTSKRPKH